MQDPLGGPIDATWALLEDGTAVIESAAAAGLALLREDERDPAINDHVRRRASSVLAALDAGCTRMIVGLGGSATNDGGAGMATALGVRFLDAEGHELPPGGASLARLDRIDLSSLDPRLRDVEVVAAADVTNPLCGPDGCLPASTDRRRALPPRWPSSSTPPYSATQKSSSATPECASSTCPARARPAASAQVSSPSPAPRYGPGSASSPRRSACASGCAGADLVISGEGCLDGQTQHGKAVMGVARMAADSGTTVLVVPGRLAPGWEAVLPYVDGVEPVVGGAITEAQAMESPAQALSSDSRTRVAGLAHDASRISAD